MGQFEGYDANLREFPSRLCCGGVFVLRAVCRAGDEGPQKFHNLLLKVPT